MRYLDNVKATVGTMVFTINGKNYKVESSASSAGLYSLTLETNVSTFTAKLDGVSVSGTLKKGTNNVYFDSMKVKVTGHNNVQSVVLSGSGAPVLQKDESASSGATTVYSAIKQKNLNTNSYTIIVNGETIPTAMAVAKFGTTATVPYCTVSATFNTNMVIESAELINASGNSVALKNNNGTWTATLLTTTDTYTLYANGFETKGTVKPNAAAVSVSAKIYEFKIVTRIDGVVSSSIAKLTVNGNSTTMKTEVKMTKGPATTTEYWSYVVTDNTAVNIESNGTTVTTVTPSANLGNTYVDYYTVQYDAGNAEGEVPVDNNIYLVGQDITILSQDTLSTSNENRYLAGWRADNENYVEGDTAKISGPMLLTAVVCEDLLKVHYVDHFGEFELRSKLNLSDKLVAYSGDKTLPSFTEYGIAYTLKGWILDIDGDQIVYASGEETAHIVGDVLGNSTEEVNVYFTAVYDVDFENDIHFELEFSEEDDPTDSDVVVVGHVGDTFTVDYRVTINDGAHALLLLPQYNKEIFKIVGATANNGTALGVATISADESVEVFKIAFDSVDLFTATGDVLFSIQYEVINNVPGKYTDFGLVLDYPTDTLSTTLDNLHRTNAWAILKEVDYEDHMEVKVYVDKLVAVTIQAPGSITIEEQTVVYHGASLTVGDVYALATEFEEGVSYYEYVNGQFVLCADVTENDFASKNYYVTNTLNDVLYNYSAFGLLVECAHPSTFIVKWYTYDEGTDEYTEIEAPKNIGDYYVGVAATANDYVYSVNEVRQLVHIVRAEITYTIHDKTSVWGDELVALTGEITEGELYEGDDLNIVLSTTATSDSVAGAYPIVGVYNNDNYVVTFVDGTYTITKKQIELGLDATAKFTDGSFAYDATEKTISVVIDDYYADILRVSYSGGETGCSGNGAVHVRFNEDDEVIGYAITALFTIDDEYLQKCEFVKDDNDAPVNSLAATLTITINGITEEQFAELIAQFVTFSVVDGETEHGLTPVDNAMAYGRTYNAVSMCAKVVVGLEENDVVNDKISATVTYKLDALESVQFNAAEAYDYGDFAVKNANVYVVTVTFVSGSGYAFEAEVDPTFTITMTIAKEALTIGADATVSYLDEEPAVTIDEGADAWVEGESYSTYGIEDVQSLAYLVNSTYTVGDAAGTAYTLYWDDAIEVGNGTKSALEIFSEILYNYELTLTVTSGNVVYKRIVNVDEYAFGGYSALYDGEDHALEVLKNEVALTEDDELVSFRITRGTVEKYVVKNVVDSDDYIATVTLKDANNYVFSDSVSEYWTLNADNSSASVTKAVDVASAPLVVEIEYTKTTATFGLSGFVADEDETVLTNFTFLIDGVASDDSMAATVAGEFEVTAQSDNQNYQFTKYTMAVYQVTFVTGPYDSDVAGDGYVPQNMPETQYIFSGLDADTFDVAEVTGLFTADEPAVPTLRHYVFSMWSDEEGAANEFVIAETAVQHDLVLYAVWEERATYSITYKYAIDLSSEWNDLAADTFYSDDELRYGNELRSLEAKDWFIVDEWFTDENLQNKVSDGIRLVGNTTVYGRYRFDVGTGDVNADGEINANDITVYRQWIVGGYDVIAVQSGDEWTTVTGDEYDAQNRYFLKRVADANKDENRDIRDVSIIRMAIVGGYGWDFFDGKNVSGVEVVRTAPVSTFNAMTSGLTSNGRVRLFGNISEGTHTLNFSRTSDIYVDLGGMTLTLESLTLRATGKNATITVVNGTIRAANGITIAAPEGNVIIEGVSAYVDGIPVNLQAADSSLHFAGEVGFYYGLVGSTVPAVIHVEEGTHVVFEEAAEVVIEKIVVTQNGFVVPTEPTDAVISLDNKTDVVIEVQGNTFNEISTLAGLVSAAKNGGDCILTADIAYNGCVNFQADATLDLNGHTIRSANSIALGVSDGATLTVNGEGNVIAQEACVMAFGDSAVVINGGTFTAIDNFVVGTNGTVKPDNDMGHNTITVNGGVFNGGIQSAGYVACGIYVANSDTVVVNGGTFNVTDGVGILARSGNTTVGADVVFNVTGDGHLGKVGDSKVTVPAGKVLVLDLAAGYPGGEPTLTNNGTYEVQIVEV